MMAEEIKRGLRSALNKLKSPRHWCLILLAGAIVQSPLHLIGQEQLCFPNTDWFGGASGPNLSSLAYNDPGWLGSFRYVFGNGTDLPFAVAQGIRDGSNNLFLSFEGRGLSSLDPTTGAETSVIVVAFDFRSSGGSLYEIVIHPVHNAPSNPPSDPSGITGQLVGGRTFSTGTISGGTLTWTPQATPAWLNAARVGYWGIAGDYNWFLAFEIPNTTLPISTGTTFKLYFNIFRTVNGQYEESWWPETRQLLEPGCPQNSTIGNGCQPGGGVPNPDLPGDQWGTATIGPSSACGGVSITSQNNAIHTNNTPNSKICITPGVTTADGTICATNPNIFSANVHNSLVNSSGGIMPAPDVQARFLIANFGLQPIWDPSQWTPISVGNNPTAATTLTSADTTLSTLSWNPVSPNQALYETSQGEHQCILVKLDSTSGSVNFLNNAAVQNMDVVHASKFRRSAEISGKGFGPPPDNPDGSHNYEQVFDLHVLMHEEVLQPGQATNGQISTGQVTGANLSREGKVISQLTWIAEGCRHTGRYMLEQDQKIEICDPIGAFGYKIQHLGNAPVRNWHITFSGASLHEVPGHTNTYRVHVTQGGVAEVVTEAQPEEFNATGGGKFAVFLDGGIAIPHGTLANSYDLGPSLNAGLEYIATHFLSGEFTFGRHHFSSAAAGSDLNVYQFSADVKAYMPLGSSTRVFVRAGVGAYKFEGGPTVFGGNVGLGAMRALSSHWDLEAAYNYHVTRSGNNSGAQRFSTVQGGLRVAF